MSLMSSKKLLMQGARKLRPQDVFATTLYTGNGGTQTITNGLDLAGKGGLVWTKARNRSGNASHAILDTVRGPGPVGNNGTSHKQLRTDGSDAESYSNGGAFRDTISQFNANGYAAYSGSNSAEINAAGEPYVSWAFRFAKNFCVTVAYTGNGAANREIPHGLGSVPGMAIIKSRSATQNWAVWHRGLTAGQNLWLNLTNAGFNGSTTIGAPSSTSFTVGTSSVVNQADREYVAYLFAQNPDLIDCGSYRGNGGASTLNVKCGKGWRPQLLLLKKVSAPGDWIMLDAKRNGAAVLRANTSDAESSADLVAFLNGYSEGFQLSTSTLGNDAATYNYLAIREPY